MSEDQIHRIIQDERYTSGWQKTMYQELKKTNPQVDEKTLNEIDDLIAQEVEKRKTPSAAVSSEELEAKIKKHKVE